ncbi:hypothetical protein [Streptosporangium roseum]|uniref:hypothetical protein n=1 Tax=Streptosporangium roseum TaxID=2001 RepID=UPI00332037E9
MTVLGFFGVSVGDMACFGAYLALGVAFPGLLLIRALYGGRRTLPEEVALGLVLGYAIEVLAYIAARAAGMPLLVIAWPVVTYAVFAAVPGLRRHWKGSPRPAAPVWWSWSIALITAYLVAWSATRFFKLHALTWPAFGTTSLDIPFHLALIGELKNHMPPTVPMVAGESLFYHWFVYAHFAAASWITGVEPLVLLFRLVMLPMMVAFAVLIGMIGRRVVGSWAAALLVTMGALFLEAPNLHLGIEVGVFTWRPTQTWQSPTQTFGALLFAPVVLLLVDLLDRKRGTPGRWLLLGVFLIALMGAKATYLPLLGVGLAAIAVVEAVRHRRTPWPALAVLGITVACFAYAQFVLFGQARLGMAPEPLAMMRSVWGELTGLGKDAQPPLTSALVVTLLCLLSWVIGWCGICGLLSRPQLLIRPAVVLMLGVGAAGIGATLLFGHPHHSERYFSTGAYPYLGVVAVYGLFVILRRSRVPVRATACAIGAAVVATCLTRVVFGVQVPLSPGESEISLYRPYIVLVVLALLATGMLLVVNRRRLVVGAALAISMISAAGLPAAFAIRVVSAAVPTPAVVGVDPDPPVAAPMVPQGALAAGRWLRAHSDPDDLVATNTHCRWGFETPCDTREFWGAALTERRMLVEGWAFTPTNYRHWHRGLTVENLPFWDQERIRLNDAAFRSPSAASVQRLRARYGVRWLLVDERHMSPGHRLGDAANLRYRSGDYAVYQVPGDTT